MSGSNFVDYVKICCRSGKGGPGSTHFHRDKLTAKGGPDGGDGGRGGHIIIRGNAQLWTLLHLKYRKHVLGEDGVCGSSGLKTGADGTDLILDVPIGTIARDEESGEIEFEISRHFFLARTFPKGHDDMPASHFAPSSDSLAVKKY